MAGDAYPRSELLGPGSSALGELVGKGSSAGEVFNLGRETSVGQFCRGDTSAGAELFNWGQETELSK